MIELKSKIIESDKDSFKKTQTKENKIETKQNSNNNSINLNIDTYKENSDLT